MGRDLSQPPESLTPEQSAFWFQIQLIQLKLDSLKGLIRLLSFIIIALCVCSLGFNVMRTLLVEQRLSPLRAAVKYCQIHGCQGHTFKNIGDSDNG